MDLSYTAAEEEFRDELRAWLAANMPEEWRGRASGARSTDDE